MARWSRYVPVSKRQAKAKKTIEQHHKQGKKLMPLEIEGRTIARSFWGKSWCSHLASFSDFSNRLERGQTYARNGSVFHLEIQRCHIEALVSGSYVYEVSIDIQPLPTNQWDKVKRQCAGQIGSLIELLQGTLSKQVMTIVADRNQGLFPSPKEIKMRCNCPDWAGMCKHIAAVLYGVGNRLDTHPELLFTLRGVDPLELIAADLTLSPDPLLYVPNVINDDALGDIFGIDLDIAPPQPTPQTSGKTIESPTTARKNAKQTSKSTKAPKKTSAASAHKKLPLEEEIPEFQPTGESIAELRELLEFSVADFADEIGVSPSTVSRWESTSGPLKIQKRHLQTLVQIHREIHEC